MKVAILAGGYGTRLSEETTVKPKPMVEIGGRPIVWHIMKHYAHYGFRDFVLLGGYRVDAIRTYFLNYFATNADFTVDLATGGVEWVTPRGEDWRVTVLDTGADTMTGGRVLRARSILGDDPFFLTYGDGVSDIDIAALLQFHRRMRRVCTVSAVAPPGRFGVLGLDETGDAVISFREKDQQDAGLINGGFFVCEPQIFDWIEGDATVFEDSPLRGMAAAGQLASYRHHGFWQAMDTLRDRMMLENLWASGKAPWKVW